MGNIHDHMNENGVINFDSLEAGAAKAREERKQKNLKQQEEIRKQLDEEREAVQGLLNKVGESIAADNARAAEKKIQEDIAQATQEIREKSMKENNLKTDKENNLDNAWKELLSSTKENN